MKINLTIPEWCDERHVFILAGYTELAAYKYFGEPWRVKSGRCSQCGECCEGFREVTGSPDTRILVVNGKCSCLGQDGPTKRPCVLGSAAPICCICSPCLKAIAGCTETFINA